MFFKAVFIYRTLLLIMFSETFTYESRISAYFIGRLYVKSIKNGLVFGCD